MSLVALFPGQGAQFVGMGKELYENFPVAREVFEEASDATKLKIKRLCFDGPESDLTLTENTQPCLLTVSVAAFRVAQKEYDFMPALVAGHSLGEYSALVCAGSLTLAQAAAWVRERGRAMQEAVPRGEGTMAAVMGLADELLPLLCETATTNAVQKRANPKDYAVPALVEAANFNAPGQTVLAGSTDGIAEMVALVKGDERFKGVKAIPLSVSAPFHCRLMKPAAELMSMLFADRAGDSPALRCAYIPNRTGRITQETSVIFPLLVEQIDHAVLWKQSGAAMLAAGFTRGIEFGPGKVLAGLMKRIAGAESLGFETHSAQDAKTISALGGLF